MYFRPLNRSIEEKDIASKRKKARKMIRESRRINRTK
jgi:hypothetical protein